MTDRTPVSLSEADIAAVRSWVIHEDEAVIAFNKPAGLSSQGGRIQAHTLDDLLWAFARSNGKRPDLVHRLDRDTSGVILAARTKPAAGFLGKAMQARRFRKTYLALLSAAPEPKSGTIETPLLRQEIGRESYMRAVSADTPGAQSALSRYRTLSVSDDGAVVELDPAEADRVLARADELAALGLVVEAFGGGAVLVRDEPGRRRAELTRRCELSCEKSFASLS